MSGPVLVLGASPSVSVYPWLFGKSPPTIAGGIVFQLHEMGASTGNSPVVVDEAQVGTGAPAPVGLTWIRS